MWAKRTTFACGLGLVLIAVSAASATAGAAPEATAPGSATSVASIVSAVAARTGDANPASIAWVLTTRGAANGSSGESTSPDLARESVYFAVARGRFAVHAGPPGHLVTLTGSVETLTISPRTGEIRDFGLTSSAPDLARFGSVTSVRPAAAARVAGPARSDHATNNCRPSHCYATTELIVKRPEGFNGAYATLMSNCMAVPHPNHNFIDNEIWVVSKGYFWVETGITIGSAAVGGFYPSAVWFWVDNRPHGGYHEHYGDAATLGQSQAVAIRYAGPGPTWKISGGISGTSTESIPVPAYFLEGGVESTSFRNTTFGSISQAGYWDPHDAAHDGWFTETTRPTVRETTKRMNVGWLDRYSAWNASEGGAC
jgi:hypothetical protein